MIETAKTVIRSPVLSSVLWRPGGLARPIVLAVTGSLALALAAKIQVPFWPVPMTMQSLVVLLIGIAYGSGLGGGTVLLYLAEGLAGLPVFAGSSAGPAYMAGPTAGYLVGFVLAAAFIGWLAERGWDRTLGRAAVAMSLGHVLLFVPGVLWLAVLFGWSKAVAFGVTPFIAATVFKTALGVTLVGAFWPLVRRRRSDRE
jgi:biotin transport system substrate-specific component